MKGNDAFDYKRFDRLHVAVRTDKLEELIEGYRCFAWTETERQEDKRYDNIMHVTFIRPHKLPHKDRLQLLQVDMELAMNRLASAEQKRYAGTLAFGLTAGMASCALIGGGVSLAVLLFSPWAVAVGAVIASLGAAAAAVCVPAARRIKRREEKKFEAAERSARQVIAAARSEAKLLTGDKNE